MFVKNRRFAYVIALLLLVVLLIVISLKIAPVSAIGTFDFILTPHTHGYGSVSLDWNGYDYEDKNFKVYKSTDGVHYETVGIDYTLVDEVRCLQIYPDVGAGDGQLITWMETHGYGKDIIKVDEVGIDDFNANPNGYLKKSNGDWKYDVIFFGTWDCNGGKDISESARIAVESYIRAGKGAIFAHDTIVNNWFSYPNFRTLAPYCGVNIVDDCLSLDASEQVIIQKKGLFTTYPWYIGEVGTVLTIPAAHTIGQVVTDGTSWLRFTTNGSTMADGQIAPSYLTTYNNCAIIQTGHSEGAATDDEQKILANLIFYVNQLIFNRHDTRDSSAQDLANPNNPTVSVNGLDFNFTATDNGSTYYYYVESYDKNDTTPTGMLDKTPVKTVTVTTGVTGYRYILSNNASETVTMKTGTYTTNVSLPISNTYKYLHIAAVDGAGNISGTTTIEIPKLLTVTFDANGGTLDVDGSIADTTTKTVVQNSVYGTLPVAERTAYTFDGWFTGKTDGTEVSADTKVTSSTNHTLYAHWKPIEYTITYELDGGTMTGQRTKYTIETATFSIPKPTKAGYLFTGWTGSNGTTPQEDVQIVKGSTGDKSYTANWIEKTGKITLTKISALPDITDGNACYALNGAEYTIYTDINCTNSTGKKITTDVNGNGSIEGLPLGTYYVKETKASTGYELDKTVYIADCTETDDLVTEALIESSEVPGTDGNGIVISKTWSGETTATIPTLAGTEFCVNYYDAYYTTANEAVGATPKRTWTIQVQEDVSGAFVTALNDSCKVGGDEFYLDANGNIVLPYGTITIRETKPAAGYTVNGEFEDEKGNVSSTSEVYLTQVKKTDGVISLQGGSSYSAKNDPIDSTIKIQKYDMDGVTGLQGVEFELKDHNGDVVATKTTDEHGMIVFDGLYPDIYTVTETKTVEGHQLLAQPITIYCPLRVTEQDIIDSGIDSTLCVYDVAEDIYYIFSQTYEVTNTVNFTMPMSGGVVSHTVLIPLMIGMAVLTVAFVLVFCKKRNYYEE